MDPITGYVSIISDPFVGNHIVLAGATLDNANDNFYYYAPGSPNLNAVDLSTGNLSSTLPLNDVAGSYFDQIQFNCNDSGFYGLLRTSEPPFQMRLGKLDLNTGQIDVLSATSVGSAHQTDYTYDRGTNTYYFSVTNTITAIDMTNGDLLGSTEISLADGEYFENIAYNCSDGEMYGTYRNGEGIRAARVDLATGDMTLLTSEPFAMYFAIGAGNVLDDGTGLYYF
ncbi:MAG: hypothetical protein M3R08_06270, partial [Bacteroidota bacterium]|nr:hypothetical protein [Bacteroidota bacterium]